MKSYELNKTIALGIISLFRALKGNNNPSMLSNVAKRRFSKNLLRGSRSASIITGPHVMERIVRKKSGHCLLSFVYLINLTDILSNASQVLSN